ncbi:MAG TPA: hypothetical protein VHK22_06345 [Gaiellaceae bacterium]|nr:hypothetical protein [Gaiellaceae bacterium]
MRELDLERELRTLGQTLVVPVPPDLVPAVLERIDAAPVRRPVWRRRLVLALAALALAAAAAFAVPPARTAILDLLHIRGATVERVDEPPAVRELDLGLAEPVSLEEGRRLLAFEPLVPDFPGLGGPDAVYVDRYASGGQVVFLYGTEDAARLLVSEFRGDTNPVLIGKQAGPGTVVEQVMVAGEPGFWVAGEPHELLYLGPDGEPRPDTVRLAANALLWQRGPLTLRIEGDITKEHALELAATLP